MSTLHKQRIGCAEVIPSVKGISVFEKRGARQVVDLSSKETQSINKTYLYAGIVIGIVTMLMIAVVIVSLVCYFMNAGASSMLPAFFISS